MKDHTRNKRKATFTLPAADKAVVRMGAGVTATAIEIAEKQQTTAEKIGQLVLPTIHCRVSKGMGMLFAGIALLSIKQRYPHLGERLFNITVSVNAG